ncbi:hypothetical protein [Pseudomonas zhanjiangensis]|uniref:YXWGXW repeat-containing protein n=1 Tax=Pseudomonas zhanjiangensis TaxID=3239015 RepID=A0ABV3YUM1_9PSED
MSRLPATVLLVGLLGLAGCALQGPQPVGQGPLSQAHPRYAPPPGVQSQWDARLGVYVLTGARDLYYRERTYYRWNNGWSWATSVQGPWQPTDSSGVPPGLYRHYPH